MPGSPFRRSLLKYVILRSEATKNLIRLVQNRDSSLPSVASPKGTLVAEWQSGVVSSLDAIALPPGVNPVDSNKTHGQNPHNEQCPNAAHDALASTWRAVLADLKLGMPQATFDACLRRTRAVKRENGLLTVAVPGERDRQWCAGRLAPLVRRSLRHVTGEDLEVEFQVADPSRGEGHQSGPE
jgi:hypothetical protein